MERPRASANLRARRRGSAAVSFALGRCERNSANAGRADHRTRIIECVDERDGFTQIVRRESHGPFHYGSVAVTHCPGFRS